MNVDLRIKYMCVAAILFFAFVRILHLIAGIVPDFRVYLVPPMLGLVAGFFIGNGKRLLLLKISELTYANTELAIQSKKIEDIYSGACQNKNYLQAILDNAGLPIYLKDTEGKYIIANKVFCALAAKASDDIIGKTDYEIFPKNMASLFRNQDRVVVKKQSNYEFEETLVLPDGEHSFLTYKFPLYNSKNELYAVGGVCTDITERTSFERKIMEEKKVLETTACSIADGLLTTDIDGKILFINPIACELTGYTQNEALGMLADDIIKIHDQEDDAQVTSPVQQLLSNKSELEFSFVASLKSKYGQSIQVRERGQVILDNANNVVGSVILISDVTNELKLEAELLSQQKLDSVVFFAAGIAHDFNNLITGVIGNIDVAMNLIDTSSKARSLVEHAGIAAKRAGQLTNQLLLFSRGESLNLKNIDLKQIIIQSINSALLSFSGECKFDISIPEYTTVLADAVQLSQVFQNLAVNASQSMENSGKIIVKCLLLKATDEDNPLNNIDAVKISVADKGIGMSKDIVKNIFEPHFTTKDEGTGLGLALVHSIVTRHKGEVYTETEPNEGSVFSVYLPAIEDASLNQLQAQNNASTELISGEGLILVMDDEEIVRLMLGDMLTYLGYEAILIDSGEKVIDEYKTQTSKGNNVLAVLLDLNTPNGMSGEEAAQKIIKFDKSAYLVLSTGYSETALNDFHANLGFKAVLTKPYSLSELGRCLHNIASK